MSAPIQPVGPIEGVSASAGLAPGLAARPGTSFGQLLLNGVDKVEASLVHAEAMQRAFVLDDSVPLHQVVFAQTNARLAFETLLQVRSRLVEGYQEIMRMQL